MLTHPMVYYTPVIGVYGPTAEKLFATAIIAITLVNKNSFVKSCFYTSNIVTKSTSKICAKICGGVNGRGVKERER